MRKGMSQSGLKVEKEDPGTGYMFGDTRTEGDFARMSLFIDTIF